MEERHPTLPKTLVELLKALDGYVDAAPEQTKPRYDANAAGVALVDTRAQGQNEGQEDMTGVTNLAGVSGCFHCWDKSHWKNKCKNRHVTGAELVALRKKNMGASVAPQLLHVSEEKEETGDVEDDPSLGDLEGVALASPAAGTIVRLEPDKLYLDSCASDTQVYTENFINKVFETHVGLHTISNGGQNTASESGFLLGAMPAWLVRSGVANLLSIPDLERRGFRTSLRTGW